MTATLKTNVSFLLFISFPLIPSLHPFLLPSFPPSRLLYYRYTHPHSLNHLIISLSPPTHSPSCFLCPCLLPPPPFSPAVTTDVQRASAVFYDTTVSLNCSFAAGSSARACLFVFTLTNEDRQENITISQHEGNYSLFIANCSLMNNTLYAVEILCIN